MTLDKAVDRAVENIEGIVSILNGPSMTELIFLFSQRLKGKRYKFFRGFTFSPRDNVEQQLKNYLTDLRITKEELERGDYVLIGTRSKLPTICRAYVLYIRTDVQP